MNFLPALGVLFAVALPTLALADTMELTTTRGSFLPGSDGNVVSIRWTNSGERQGAQFAVRFDSELLTAVEVRPFVLPPMTLNSSIHQDRGEIWFVLFDPNATRDSVPLEPQSLRVAEILLSVDPQATGATSIGFIGALGADSTLALVEDFQLIDEPIVFPKRPVFAVAEIEARRTGEEVHFTGSWSADATLPQGIDLVREGLERQTNIATGLQPGVISISDRPGTSDVVYSLTWNGIVLRTIPVLPDLPSSVALYQSEPNPLRTAAALRFDLPTKLDVTIELFDVSGRRVSTILDETLEAGRHSVPLSVEENLRGLSAGVYFYQMRAGSFESTRKLTITK